MQRCNNCGGTISHGVCEYCDTVWEKPALDMNVLFDESFVVSLPIKGGEKRAYFKVRCEDASLTVEQGEIDVTGLGHTSRQYVPNNSLLLDLRLRVLDKVD